jgi:hypothetical protein
MIASTSIVIDTSKLEGCNIFSNYDQKNECLVYNF